MTPRTLLPKAAKHNEALRIENSALQLKLPVLAEIAGSVNSTKKTNLTTAKCKSSHGHRKRPQTDVEVEEEGSRSSYQVNWKAARQVSYIEQRRNTLLYRRTGRARIASQAASQWQWHLGILGKLPLELHGSWERGQGKRNRSGKLHKVVPGEVWHPNPITE